MSKFLVALFLGLSLVVASSGSTAVAVQNEQLAVFGHGADGAGVLTVSSSPGTAYCVHAYQESGSYALQSRGVVPSSGSVSFAVTAATPSEPGQPMFYVGYNTGGGMTWMTIAPVTTEDGWWLW